MDDQLQPDEYQCCMCKRILKKGRSDEEAMADKDRDFPEASMDHCDTVCDDCYQRVSPAANPVLYAKYKAEMN
jgi:hypothetical protein